jgi:hypothetical protein
MVEALRRDVEADFGCRIPVEGLLAWAAVKTEIIHERSRSQAHRAQRLLSDARLMTLGYASLPLTTVVLCSADPRTSPLVGVPQLPSRSLKLLALMQRCQPP